MNSQELRALQEAYMDVYELDEDKRPIYGRGGAIRKTETPLQIIEVLRVKEVPPVVKCAPSTPV